MPNPPAPKLPDNVVEELRQLLDMSGAYQFVIGDYLVSVVDEFGHVLKRPEIIRQLAHACKCDASTLRDRESLARFASPDMRKEYEFTFSQWRSLRIAGPDWEGYAKQAAAELWSADRIRAQIKSNGDGLPAWLYWWGKLGDVLEKVIIGKDTPEHIKAWCRQIEENRQHVTELVVK